jgi:hypothetical protein
MLLVGTANAVMTDDARLREPYGADACAPRKLNDVLCRLNAVGTSATH